MYRHPPDHRRVLWAGFFLAAFAISCTAQAEIRELPVPSATIYPDTVIDESQIALRQFRVTPSSTSGFALGRGEIIGKQARRRLVAGKPVPLSALAEPKLVRRGQLVSASYSEAGFTITASFVAVEDGAENAVIGVRNSATGAVLRAVVKSDGTLTVMPQ